MFQYAVTRMIDAELTHISPAEAPYSDRSAYSDARALVFPAANHLRPGADWTGLNNYLNAAKIPLVVFGLGAQAPDREGEAATIEALKTDTHVRRLVDILREKAVLVTVRGPFSQAVCAELGLPDVDPLGCPSVFLNPDPALGAGLSARFAALKTRTVAPRLAITAAAPFEIRDDPAKRELERRMFSWLRNTDGLYVQQSGGVSAMKATDGHWYDLDAETLHAIAGILAPQASALDVWALLARQGRFYTSAPDWISAMSDRELVLGTRLHGTMAALAAGAPAAIITHDSRTSELAATMHLPQVAMQQVMASPTLAAATAHIHFDGAAFDQWRAITAARMVAVCSRIGLPLKAPISALAGGDLP
jgi:hypothetical protein